MNEMQAEFDRLEARIDAQTARIDALYHALELRGILPRAGDAGRDDAFSDGVFELEETPLSADGSSRRLRLRVGDATGV